MDARTLGLTACALVAAAIVARIFWLFANRVPVLAHSANTDALGETAPGDPLNPHSQPHGVERLSPFRTTDMRLDYQVGGKHYEHDVAATSVEGLELTAPDDMPIIWADPSNPARIEARGPGFWVIALLVVGFAAAAIFQFGA
jgi:hypothetical protein